MAVRKPEESRLTGNLQSRAEIISAVNESTLASTQLLRHFTLWAGRDYRSEEQANISFLLCKIRHMKAEHLSELPKLEFTFSFRKLKCFWL